MKGSSGTGLSMYRCLIGLVYFCSCDVGLSSRLSKFLLFGVHDFLSMHKSEKYFFFFSSFL